MHGYADLFIKIHLKSYNIFSARAYIIIMCGFFISLENHFKQFFQFFYHFNHPFPYYLSDYTTIPNLKNKYFSFHSHYSIAIVLYFYIKK